MNISTRQLRAFVTVARELHFTKASALLGTSQPALSATIRQLEDLVGAQLFDRVGRNVHLTALGEVFFASATRLLDDMEQSVRSLRDLIDKRAGFVNVAALPSATFKILAPALGEFHARYPNIKLMITDALNDRVLESVRRGYVDFGIGVPDPSIEELSEIRLIDDHYMAAIPSGHRLESKEHVKWSDLRDEQIVHVAPGSNVRRTVERELVAHGIPVEVSIEVQFVSGAIQMVRNGLGIAVLSALSCEPYIQSENLTLRPMVNPDVVRPVSVIYRTGRAFSPAAQAMMDKLYRRGGWSPS